MNEPHYGHMTITYQWGDGLRTNDMSAANSRENVNFVVGTRLFYHSACGEQVTTLANTVTETPRTAIIKHNRLQIVEHKTALEVCIYKKCKLT